MLISDSNLRESRVDFQAESTRSLADTGKMSSVSQKIRLAYVVGGMYTEASGVPRIVCDLANAVSRLTGAVSVYTAQCKGRQIADHLLKTPNLCVACPGFWAGRLAYSPALQHRLNDDIQSIDIVHNHSLWEFPNHYASASAARTDTPVTFTIHGTLEPWAIRRSRWKKRLIGWLYQNRDLRRATCLHTNSFSEIAGLREYGLKNPVAVVPNGVDLKPFDRQVDGPRFRQALGISNDQRIVMFLSRLHEKKGLAHLIQAWRSLVQGKSLREWQLVIVGPDDGFEQQTRGMVADYGLDSRVNFAGPLQGDSKIEALASADVFVLPSFSEGFSMAVLEAMAASLPVLITPGCNFDEVGSRHAGLVVPPTAQETADGLRQLMSISDADRQRMGMIGRSMVENDFTWDAVASKMTELYRWMIDGGTTPSFVRHD